MRRCLLISAFLAFALALPAYAMPYHGTYALEAAAAYFAASPAMGVNLDVGFYYDYLGSYGNWISISPYGNVWCPRNMGYGWRPYSYGYWVWTDFGWTWISDEDWGWIPFHYGRWGWDDEIGWFWVPGTTWGPAWVSWRYNNQYCGWAPLPPGIDFQAGIGFRSREFGIPNRFWIFVQAPYFLDRNVRTRVLPYERNMTIINSTTVYNNIYVRDDRIVNEGIGLDDAQRLTRKDIPRYSLRDADRPGQARISGHVVQLYRPAFQENASAQPRVFQNKDNAPNQSAPAGAYEQRGQPSSPVTKGEIEKRQTEERNLARQTQSQELKDMQRRQSEELKRARSSAEKAQVKQDYKTRESELRKSQQAERQQMTERHQRERERSGGSQPAQQNMFPGRGKRGE